MVAQDITSLGTHRTHPHLVYSTSRDFTTRIYDFRIQTGKAPDPFTRICKDPFGRRIDGGEEGNCVLGRCVVILTGGRSGGHEAGVLGAVSVFCGD